MMVPQQSQAMRYTANFPCPSGGQMINPSGDQNMYESNRSRSDSGTSGSSGGSKGNGKPPQTMRYTANFSCPSGDQMMYESNRSRADSGTSGSSESSRGSGKPPRRRSHRPRGCRGGSSRRRNNSVDNANGKLPVKSNVLSPNNKVRIANNKQKSRTEQSSSKNNMDPSREQNHYSIPVQDFSFQIPHPRPPSLSRSYQDCNFQDGKESISLSAATAPSTDYSSNAGSSYDHSSPPFYQSQMSFEFPAILQSFSDSSFEDGMEQQKQLHNYSNILPPCAHITNTKGNNDDGYILPPLPSNAFENEPIPSGPNPYALKLSTHPEGYYSRHPQPPLSRQHGYGYPTMTNPQFQQQPPSLQMPYSNQHNQQQHPPYDYHAERLEKQRQNVEGGSLFCTSPRSFLMGRKTEA
jgi:hypothetical protein